MLGIERRAEAVTRDAAMEEEAKSGQRPAGPAPRARGVGERHRRLALVTIGGILAGVIAICAYQLGHGAYLGRGWVIAALAGMLTAAVLGAVVLIHQRRHFATMGSFEIGWLVLWPVAVSGFRFPFPVVPYGSVQAFFNVVHAALLGNVRVVRGPAGCSVLSPTRSGRLAVLTRAARARTRRAQAPGRH